MTKTAKKLVMEVGANVDSQLAQLVNQWTEQRTSKSSSAKNQKKKRKKPENTYSDEDDEEHDDVGVSSTPLPSERISRGSLNYYGVEEEVSIDGNIVFKAVGSTFKTPLLAALAYDKNLRKNRVSHSKSEEEKKDEDDEDDDDFMLLNFPDIGDCAVCGDLTVPLNAALPSLPDALLFPLMYGETLAGYKQRSMKKKWSKKNSSEDSEWSFLSVSGRGGEKAMLLSGLSKYQEPTLLCDRCDNEVHLSCAELSEVPSGSWYCPKCINEKEKKSSSSSFSVVSSGQFKVEEVKYLGVRPLPSHDDWIQEKDLPSDSRLYPSFKPGHPTTVKPITTPFNCYADEQRPTFPAHWPEVQINKIISNRWRKMTEEDKTKYSLP